MNIQIKVPEPKPFHGEQQNAKSWQKLAKRYFIAADLSEQDDVHNAQMSAITQALIQGKTSKWLDRLGRLGTALTIFTDFCTKFLE